MAKIPGQVPCIVDVFDWSLYGSVWTLAYLLRWNVWSKISILSEFSQKLLTIKWQHYIHVFHFCECFLTWYLWFIFPILHVNVTHFERLRIWKMRPTSLVCGLHSLFVWAADIPTLMLYLNFPSLDSWHRYLDIFSSFE